MALVSGWDLGALLRGVVSFVPLIALNNPLSVGLKYHHQPSREVLVTSNCRGFWSYHGEQSGTHRAGALGPGWGLVLDCLGIWAQLTVFEWPALTRYFQEKSSSLCDR